MYATNKIYTTPMYQNGVFTALFMEKDSKIVIVMEYSLMNT